VSLQLLALILLLAVLYRPLHYARCVDPQCESCLSRSYQRFQSTWSQTQRDAQASAMSTTTLVFERIWTNKHLAHGRRKAVSIWRPVPSQGYVAVGDCLVVGSWTAPRSAVVLTADQGELSLVKSALVREPTCLPLFLVVQCQHQWSIVWNRGQMPTCLAMLACSLLAATCHSVQGYRVLLL
jgi:hypothetical protein